MIPLGAHLGSEPLFSISRVVSSEPVGLKLREMTSTEATWDAKGFG